MREKLTMIHKSKDCLRIKPLSKDKKDNNVMVINTMPPLTGLTCYICGESNHVPSIYKNGKHHVDYFSCRKFVEMSAKYRRIELQKKNSRMKCDEKHKCYERYVPKGLHVLVCEAHRKKQPDIDLLEDYKKTFKLDVKKF